MTSPEFDRHALTYEADIERAIGFGGMEHAFFTRAKAEVLLELAADLGDPARLSALRRQRHRVGRCLPCRPAGATRGNRRLDRTASGCQEGQSRRLVHRQQRRGPAARDGSLRPGFRNHVPHHVPLAERPGFMRELHRVVRPGGLLVVIEHNPVNPLTRLVVARCSFDEDVALLGRRETERLLRACGGTGARSRYILFFPAEGRGIRRLERCRTRSAGRALRQLGSTMKRQAIEAAGNTATLLP